MRRAVAAIIALRAQRHLDEGLARTAGEVDIIVSDFHALARDAGRKDLVWKYGLNPDVLDPGLRTKEFGNWLNAEVLPRSSTR